MGVIKGIGYFITSILVLSVLLGGVLLVATLAAMGGVFFLILGVVLFVALLIKEFFENASSK